MALWHSTNVLLLLLLLLSLYCTMVDLVRNCWDWIAISNIAAVPYTEQNIKLWFMYNARCSK